MEGSPGAAMIRTIWLDSGPGAGCLPKADGLNKQAIEIRQRTVTA